MTAEAIARLRGAVSVPRRFALDPERADDIRILLDAHDEALAVLALFVHTGDEFADDYDAKAQARAVLAKAGRR
jgi:hypothetical protein